MTLYLWWMYNYVRKTGLPSGPNEGNMTMVVGIRWDASNGIPAETVLRVENNKSIGTFPFIGKAKYPVFEVAKTSEQEVVFFDGSQIQPSSTLVDLENRFHRNFGFKPELVIKTEDGFVSLKSYFQAVGARINALPTSKYDTF